jgi:hypothetical protein
MAIRFINDLGVLSIRRGNTEAIIGEEELLQHYRARAAYQLGALECHEVDGTELPISWDELNHRVQKDWSNRPRSTATVDRTHTARTGPC